MNRYSDEIIDAHGVRLRSLGEADIPAIVTACSDDLTQEWLPLPRPYDEAAARSFVSEMAPTVLASGQGIIRAIEVNGEFCGVIDLRDTDWKVGSTETGYWMGPWARGRGIMARAVSALAEWAFDAQGLHRVQLRAAPGNIGSINTARKAFFIREGLMRQASLTHFGRVDLVLFSRLKNDPRPQFPPLRG